MGGAARLTPDRAVVGNQNHGSNFQNLHGEALSQRIAALEQELRTLRRQQDERLFAAIVAVIGIGINFNARELWRHQRVRPALEAAFVELHITSARTLGKHLQRLVQVDLHGWRLVRLGADYLGAIWQLEKAESGAALSGPPLP
jgi:hypothetical protein